MAESSASDPAHAVRTELAELEAVGGVAFALEVTGLFLEDAPARIRRARAALEEGDVATIARQAHALHGSAGPLGAHEVSRRAAVLEQLARAAEKATAELDAALTSVEEALAVALAALAAWRSERAAAQGTRA